MAKQQPIPVALTIAGSDSGGGAGVQADLKAFAALGVHGTSAITCLTAQNPKRVLAIDPVRAAMVVRQIEAVFEELPPQAVKTGMLYSAAIIRAVAKALAPHRVRLIVDPVMVATSGARLLQRAAVDALRNCLLPMAALVTPNLAEAEVLTGRPLFEPEDMRAAARSIVEQFGCAALVKGGHLRNTSAALDIFYDGKTELLLSAPYVKGVQTHGTGCTYAAAITAAVARGEPLKRAVVIGKNFVTQAIQNSLRVARHRVLNPFGAD